MGALTAPVQPQVLKWARESASLDVATAAARIGVKPERLESWESGSRQPTLNQVRTMANVYVRPLGALFMVEPLSDDVVRRIPDFRSPATRSHIMTKALQGAVMRAHLQRDALRDIAEALDLPEVDTTAQFRLSASDPAEVTAERLRAILGMDSFGASKLSAPDSFLRELVQRAESLSVTVIQTQRVDVSEMRGFSLGDGSCPIVALNGGDWPRGKAFTLLHELAHIGFRSSGLCDFQHADESRLERLCDSVAAATLMPAAVFLKSAQAQSARPLDVESLRTLGSEFGASGEAALLRMISLKRAKWEDYWKLKPSFDEAYRSFRSAQQQSSAHEDLPLYYQLKRRDLGRRFIQQAVTGFREDVVSSRDLAHMLGVTFDKVSKLVGSAEVAL